MQWLLCLTTKVLCEGRNVDLFSSSQRPFIDMKYDTGRDTYEQTPSIRSCGRRTISEYQLITSFLSRVTLANVRNALKWIQRNAY